MTPLQSEPEAATRPREGNGGLLHLLDADPELAETIPAGDRELARRKLVCRALRFEPGDSAIDDFGPPGSIGLLVLEGFLTRDVAFGGERSRELLGSGDLLRPRDIEDDFLPPFSENVFTVLEPTRVAELDQGLLRLGARWPAFVDELLHRTLRRSRWLAIRLAINSITRVDERLLLFYWHAAGRWGRVTSEGVVLPLALTHEVLAELIGAQRPSVTTALTALKSEGRLRFRVTADGCKEVLLLGDPPGDTSSDGDSPSSG